MPAYHCSFTACMYLYSIAFCTVGASRKVNTFDLVIGVKLISHLLKTVYIQCCPFVISNTMLLFHYECPSMKIHVHVFTITVFVEEK